MVLLVNTLTRRIHSAFVEGEEPSIAPPGFELIRVEGNARTFVWPHRDTRGHSRLDEIGRIVFEPPVERKIDVLIDILRIRPLFFSAEELNRLDAAD